MSAVFWMPSRIKLQLVRARAFAMDISIKRPTCVIHQRAPARWSFRHKLFVNPVSYGRLPETILR